ncbi:hypothetical protein BXZ70DRAFT_689651 [Cristinia sonorae]|uniref:Hydrophobin n=1 Tax=Cristinia sonorae TaxID=1940300 RepID=A0A8K0UET8_9AGAR|nr:hypothetical protein BXZ70DRAFT_689651 [Cristinia sonorae]
MSATFTRLAASFTTFTGLLAVFAVATPQAYQPYRPYDPTSVSNSVAISSSATTSADFASPGAAASVFGNDGDGLDNGVDDNDGTPFGIDTSRGGSGSNDDGEEEEPTPTAPEPISCAGTIQCCSPAGVIISANSDQGLELINYVDGPEVLGDVALECTTIGPNDGASCPASYGVCCTGYSRGLVYTGCLAIN